MIRLRLVTDDSGHWYVIPAEQQGQFEKWVESFDTDLEEYPELGYTGPDFDRYRLNMHISNYTFTDLKEEG